jgi:hypothetical protein
MEKNREKAQRAKHATLLRPVLNQKYQEDNEDSSKLYMMGQKDEDGITQKNPLD